MARKPPWWRRFNPASVQEMVTESNDGIIAVAGMAMGLVGAEVSNVTAMAVITISSVAGALSIFGVKLGQNYAQRESQQSTLREEQRLLELSPQEEVEELSEWFEARGVSENTSLLVAKELSKDNALAVQLELGYGIRAVVSLRFVWMMSIFSGLSFIAGAMIPLSIAYLVPFSWKDEYTIITAMAALVVTSIILAWLGRARFWPTLARTLAVGTTTLGITFFLGDWLI